MYRQQLLQGTSPKLRAGFICRNDPQKALFNDCSKAFGPFHIWVTQAKIDFRNENLVFLSEITRPRLVEP